MVDFIPWLVSSVGVFIIGTAYCLKLRMLREHKLEQAANEFFQRVQPLIEDEGAPESALDLLAFINREITHGAAARRMFLCLLRRRSEPRPRLATAIARELHDYYMVQRPELGKILNQACAAAMLAVSYQSRIFGLLVRRLILFDVCEHQDRAPDLMVSMRAHEIDHRVMARAA